LPRIIKSDGERQPFNGVKLKGGMLRALEKRPLSSEEVDAVFGSILTEIRQLGEREIASRQLGEIVMRNLKRVDQVAYVRFASVYRDFQDIKEFAEEISSLSKEKPKTRKKNKCKSMSSWPMQLNLQKKVGSVLNLTPWLAVLSSKVQRS
jgi:transcriptional repressor NrdR